MPHRGGVYCGSFMRKGAAQSGLVLEVAKMRYEEMDWIG